MNEIHTLDDETLCVLVADGNTEAEEVLIQRFSRLVKVGARPYFLAGGDSEDLTQEGMLGLISAIRTFRFDSGASFRTYAETCIRRRLLTAIKSASRYKHIPLNHAISFESSHVDEIQAVYFLRDPEDQILARERADEMWGQFAHVLSGFEHEILRLFLEGQSYQEMASHVQKPIKSVDNAVQRIRKKLAQHLIGEISEG
ncbi:MAG: sigma-70 family RNA polymerase sigma factor [Oscillospiraceae bacterium]|nr:sigma-70 family RNA polymerase sigma factor [Oscillospiraceae bacterium]